MDNINDYAEKYSAEIVEVILNEGITAIGKEYKMLILKVAKLAYVRGFQDSQSIEWSKMIKRGCDE